ncbi:MAG TPA: hypothetical protein VNW94_06615 [Streptosporangiaceae bacterium]|jgi:hypothetical protein|nr:hypothetical protein [Streptosporangiaceae bacterium]
MSTPPPPGSLPPPLDGTAAQKLPPGQAPNPLYRQLYQAYQDAYGSIDRLRHALDPALRTLNGTDAWLGPESRSWGGQLSAQQQTLRSAADRILWDIYTTLAATDRVTAHA